jgi:hypothetical protein
MSLRARLPPIYHGPRKRLFRLTEIEQIEQHGFDRTELKEK